MCGIMGYVGQRSAAPIILAGLQRLEYRGYDSAGIAVLANDGQLSVHKAAGKLSALSDTLTGNWPEGHIGLGHTRWATHGRPSERNAHPHLDCSGEVVVVHNGIVENHAAMRQELIERQHRFTSETDTEIIAHIIEERLQEGEDLASAVRRTVAGLAGGNALLVMSKREPSRLIAARVGNAGGVVVGYGAEEMFLASDLPALLPHTHRVVFLRDGEMASVGPGEAQYFRLDGSRVHPELQTVPYHPEAAARGSYKHFMLKEIMEQPQALMDTISSHALLTPPTLTLPDVRLARGHLRQLKRVILIAMGTSLHAAMVGRHYMERIAGIPAEVDNASEFRYRDALVDAETLVVSVSQSGETVDTLEAMMAAKAGGAPQITICNVVGSQAARIADGAIFTRCGLEVGVASTKTFTAALAALYLLACHIGQARGRLDDQQLHGFLGALGTIPNLAGKVLQREEDYRRLAHLFFRRSNFLYLARGINYPIALEGALKLKEVSYIHAEGYPAGEMKHGPIALIDQEMPVMAIAVKDSLRDKMLSNIEQVKAREGTVIAIATEGDVELAAKADHVLYVPEAPPLLTPILTAIPLQLLAYHMAVRRGCDVDQPRNLAKTVTVE